MRIDPSSPKCAPFFAKLAELGIPLLSHGGKEQAVEVAPLRLRRALDAGVKVIVAHCASSGDGEDLAEASAPPTSNFELFLRMMDDAAYRGRLWGEISATTQRRRSALRGRGLHAREQLVWLTL